MKLDTSINQPNTKLMKSEIFDDVLKTLLQYRESTKSVFFMATISDKKQKNFIRRMFFSQISLYNSQIKLINAKAYFLSIYFQGSRS